MDADHCVIQDDIEPAILIREDPRKSAPKK